MSPLLPKVASPAKPALYQSLAYADRDQRWSLHVGRRDDNQAPPGRFECFTAVNVPLPLARIAFVLPAVVLDDEFPLAEHQVAAGEPSTIVVEDVDVEFRFRKPSLGSSQRTSLSRGEATPDRSSGKTRRARWTPLRCESQT